MDNQEKVQGLNIVMHGITINGPMFDIHDNHNIVINAASPTQGEEHSSATPATRGEDSFEKAMKAAEACGSLLTRKSSWAVVYCVCCKHLGVDMSVSAFFRRVADYPIKPNLPSCSEASIRKAFENNNYMHEPFHKWKETPHKKLAKALIRELGE